MKYRIIIFFTFLSLMGFSNTHLDSLFITANAHYQTEKYAEAIDNYQTILDSNYFSFEPIPQLFYIKWWNNITNQLSLKIWSVLLITGIWLSSFFLILFIKNRKKWKFNGLLLSIIITFLMGAQMYNANIQQNKVYGIILKEAKLFDDNINYGSILSSYDSTATFALSP